MSINSVKCLRCDGRGSIAKAGQNTPVECSSCNGKGRITYADATLTEEDKRILALEDEVRQLRAQLAEAERRASSWSLSYQKLLERVKAAVRRTLPEGTSWPAASLVLAAIDEEIQGRRAS